MLATKKFVLGILVGLVSTTGYATTLGQVELLERTNAMTAKVIRYAKQQSAKFGKKQVKGEAWTKLSGEVEDLLATEKSPAVLARVALMTRILLDAKHGSDDYFDEAISEVFREAWFGCIKNIKRTGGPEALAALDDIKRTLEIQTLDGAPSLALRKAREEVEQGLKNK